MKQYYQYPLVGNNTFGISARAFCFAEYSCARELQRFVRGGITNRPVFHIGGGSNVLFLGDYEGTILHSAIRDFEAEEAADGSVRVRAGSGLVWDNLVAQTIDMGLCGLENLSLIPGEVGASAVQNIGAYGSEAAGFITEVEAVDLETGEMETFAATDLEYGYRQSRFKGEWKGRYAITHVTFRLSREFTPNLSYTPLRQAADEQPDDEGLTPLKVRNIVIGIRRSKLPDPKELGNGGSFFTNPIVPTEQARELVACYPEMPCFAQGEGKSKLSAAWLIDKAGWRGHREGRAGVYEKQPLVLVNLGGATGRDISRLAELIIADVKQKFGITLTPEVNFV